MSVDNMILSCSQLELSEHKNYLELVNRVCYYDYPNANGAMILYDDAALEKANTLVDMPVQAKYKTNANGEPTFGGHEVREGENGEWELCTESIGTHTQVWIETCSVETADGTIKELPCLFARQKIWKRYKNVVCAIRRLFSEGKLFNSWEMEYSDFTYKDGIKTIQKYSFLGNAFLGYEYADPAYGKSAAVLSLSQNVMVAEALSQDMREASSVDMDSHEVEEASIASESKEEMDMKDKEIVLDECKTGQEYSCDLVENQECSDNTECVSSAVNDNFESQDEKDNVMDASKTGEENANASVGMSLRVVVSEDGRSSTFAFGNDDISVQSAEFYQCVNDAIGGMLGENGYVAIIDEADHAILYRAFADVQNDYRHFFYNIENNACTVSCVGVWKAPSAILSFPAILEEKEDMLAAFCAKIRDLQDALAQLDQYKAYYDADMAHKEELRHAQAVTALREYVASSQCFTKEEVDSDPIKGMIDELKEIDIKAMVADRMIEKYLRNSAKAVSEINVHRKEITPVPNLLSMGSDADKADIMRSFLH